MLNEHTINKINEVETKGDYDYLMNSFKLSSAPLELRQEAMKALQVKYPQYDDAKHTTSKEVLQMIKDSEADIDDINGY